MIQRQKTHLSTRLRGQRVLFYGRFTYELLSRLEGIAGAQNARIVDIIGKSVNYLIVPKLSERKNIQKEAVLLNARGANIQILDADAFEKLITPTATDISTIIRDGKTGARFIAQAFGENEDENPRGRPPSPAITITGCNFDGLDLSGFNFRRLAFKRCSFEGAALNGTEFGSAVDCNFSHAIGDAAIFRNIERSRFVKVILKGAEFVGHLVGTNFTDAILERTSYSENPKQSQVVRRPMDAGPIFTRAVLCYAQFRDVIGTNSAFDLADLTCTTFNSCKLKRTKFSRAILKKTRFASCDLTQADMTEAQLIGAHLAEAKLHDACLIGADLADCNLRGADLSGTDLRNARNLDRNSIAAGSIGTALKELDVVATAAQRIRISFRVSASASDRNEEIHVTSYGGKYQSQWNRGLAVKLLEEGNEFGHLKVQFGTVKVESEKSPIQGKALRDKVIAGIAEAFVQTVPEIQELAAVTKASIRKLRAEAALAHRNQKKAEKRQIAKIARKVAKEVGKVTDTVTFLKALTLRIDKSKINKATKMLKTSGFKLFHSVTKNNLIGVVKSQSDPDLIYACRVNAQGQYACCTQNLNICGGVRGSICKHLLVLLIGLVQAGKLDPAIIDSWISKTLDTKPELNKETMAAILFRYKGAEAGEVDWRPMQTVPEDYYTL